MKKIPNSQGAGRFEPEILKERVEKEAKLPSKQNR
jgi:hypothetical protein